MNITYPAPFVLALAGSAYQVRFWAGEVLTASEVAIDTETEVMADHEVPRLALVTVSAGTEHYIVHPYDVPAFLDKHRTLHWIFFNVAFDFWALHQHLMRTGSENTAALLWEKAARGEMHDAMLLDMLVGLARTGLAVPRDLAKVAADWSDIKDLDKADPYRLRYGEIIGKDWHEIEGGFFAYAIKDAIATFRADQAMRASANQISQTWQAWLWPEAMKRFGPLSETVQVKGAIALAAVGRRGLRVDRASISKLRASLAETQRGQEKVLFEFAASPDLVKRTKVGEIVRTKSGLPSFNKKALHRVLERILKDTRIAGLAPVPRDAGGDLSEVEADWMPYAPHHSFVAAWLELRRCGKLMAYAILPEGERIHPQYSILKRTGRTSAAKPNLQQMPCKGGFREYFIPSEGCYLFTIDYRFIELVTMAAIFEMRFGRSKLAEVIRNGIDPHCFTAALITDTTLDEFMALEKAEPARFKELRQKAKALNFGIPGGLGAKRLMEYAHDNFGVSLTQEEATDWRERLVCEVYPEIAQYLADRTMAALAWNLGTTEAELWNSLGHGISRPIWLSRCVCKVLSGNETKANGEPYDTSFVDSIWAGLVRACRRPELHTALITRRAGGNLAALSYEVAVTPTGRLRAGATYTEARNTPFQGLASDGAKLAAFALVNAGYHLVGFVHDEFILELPKDLDHAQEAKRIEGIVCDAMAQAVNGMVPVSVEFALSTCWSKGAKAKHDKDGRLLPWSPPT
ncbi:MAG: DNA polymerase [Planctomycetota bacterium]|nr:DNA polymerase [Planctomycetota bacterium]